MKELVQIHEIINDLDGNGIDSGELLQITEDLTNLAEIKERIVGRLSDIYGEEEASDIISVVRRPNEQQLAMMNFMSSLSEREKQCYFMSAIDHKSFAVIGRELQISKSSVQQYIERARKKLRNQHFE